MTDPISGAINKMYSRFGQLQKLMAVSVSVISSGCEQSVMTGGFRVAYKPSLAHKLKASGAMGVGSRSEISKAVCKL